MKFEESKHPRDSDGKFTDKNGKTATDKIRESVKKYSDTPTEDMVAMGVSEKPSVIKVNLSSDIQKQFDKATPKERQKIAFDYIMKNLRGKYPTHDGRIVAIERVGADKMTHSFDERKIRVLPELKSLIDAGRLRGVIDVQHKLFSQMAYYDVEFAIGKTCYKTRLNIGIRKNGDSTLYDIKPIEDTKKSNVHRNRLLTSE